MKKIAIYLIFIMCIHHMVKIHASLQGRSFFSPRSQSTNAARDLVGWHPFIHRYDMHNYYGGFTITPEYTHSLRAIRIAQALFGTDILTISGSQITNRGTDDILADYFGLSPAFQSEVHLDPLIQNALLTFDGYIGLDALYPGLYIQIHCPFVWTQWNLRLSEIILSSGSTTPFPAQYMTVDALQAPVASFIDAMKGTVTFGHMQEPLASGIINGSQSKLGVADIQCIFGWDFIASENGHAGLNVRLGIPLGNRPQSKFLFEPIVGNGKHWEFGLGFSGSILLWEKDNEQTLKFFTDANLTHLFTTHQRRSFDLCANGFGSRYILVKEFSDGNYTGKLAPLINKTTLDCNVRVDMQLDVVFMFGYTYNNFLFDAGYNGWIRSREIINLRNGLQSNTFGLKGIQDVTTSINQLSNVTQSTATLMGNSFADQANVADQNSPLFISTADINRRSAGSPRLLTHKLFLHVGYIGDAWYNNRIFPIIGIGGEIEFEGINTRALVPPPPRTTLSQWGLWIKGGIAFI